MADAIVPHNSQAYKHIFTPPSSVDKVVKATRSGNERMCMLLPRYGSRLKLAYVCQISNYFCRHGSPSVPHLYSPGQIQLWILNVFMRAY